MKRWTIALVLIISCAVSSVVGYWFGFRQALPFGVAAEFLPRGVLAIGHLKAIRSGKTESSITLLEYDVDTGLLWADEVLRHPLRDILEPLWGFNVSQYEEYAVRLANYRKQQTCKWIFSYNIYEKKWPSPLPLSLTCRASSTP